MFILESHFTSALASIELDKSSATAARVARVLSLAELVELSDHMLEILRVVVAEHN